MIYNHVEKDLADTSSRSKICFLNYFQKRRFNSSFSAVETVFVLLFKFDRDLQKSLLSNLGLGVVAEGVRAWICILSMKSCRCQTVRAPTTHINMHTYIHKAISYTNTVTDFIC